MTQTWYDKHITCDWCGSMTCGLIKTENEITFVECDSCHRKLIDDVDQ